MHSLPYASQMHEHTNSVPIALTLNHTLRHSFSLVEADTFWLFPLNGRWSTAPLWLSLHPLWFVMKILRTTSDYRDCVSAWQVGCLCSGYQSMQCLCSLQHTSAQRGTAGLLNHVFILIHPSIHPSVYPSIHPSIIVGSLHRIQTRWLNLNVTILVCVGLSMKYTAIMYRTTECVVIHPTAHQTVLLAVHVFLSIPVSEQTGCNSTIGQVVIACWSPKGSFTLWFSIPVSVSWPHQMLANRHSSHSDNHTVEFFVQFTPIYPYINY